MNFKKSLSALALALGMVSVSHAAVITDGSTSMEKVMGVLIESFEGNDIDVTYNPTGSGSGISAALEGRADIGLSSRALKSDEEQMLHTTVS